MKKLLSILILTILLIACEGKEGPTGPAGEDGNANVQIYQFNFNSSDLSQYTDSRFYSFNYDFGVNTNNSSVSIYLSSATTAWYQLPMHEPTFDLSITYYFSGSQFFFDFRTASGDAKSKFIQYMNNDTDFIGKLVLIPGN